ncbi:hypothetical protein ABIA71_003622 [Stenotrophomonas sp. 2619]|uniref:hypothetical protein n=1 Tax=Stenotrophomonas sp. 2619 TaxID=3156316 RepID=UPI003398B445
MAEMKKKIKIAVGDVFAITLSSGGYGVGRLIHISDRWRLAQFFALRLDAPELPASLFDIGDVMPVHNIVTLRIEEGAWPVLKHGMFDALPDLDSLIFYRGLPAQRTYLKLNGENAPACLSEGCSSSMPQFAEYVAEQLDERLPT